MTEDGTVEFEDVVALSLSKSGQALNCRFLQDNRQRWIPVSVIHDNSEVWKPGQKGTLVLPEWFALKEGLI
jgi:hypothetical protein